MKKHMKIKLSDIMEEKLFDAYLGVGEYLTKKFRKEYVSNDLGALLYMRKDLSKKVQ
jgi:hypothetical protein